MSEYSISPEKARPLETMAAPEDSFEVKENTFAVASAADGRRFLYTSGLYDCKSIIAYSSSTQKATMAHLSCTEDPEGAIAKILQASSIPTPDMRVTIVTGSRYDKTNDSDAPAWGDEDLIYPSLRRIQIALEAQGVRNIATDIAEDPAKPRSVALDLTTGRIHEVDDSKIIDWSKLDDSRNQVIEPRLLF